MLSLTRSLQQLIIRKLDLYSFLNLRRTCKHFRNARPGIVNLLNNKNIINKIKEMSLQNQIDEIYYNAILGNLGWDFPELLSIVAKNVNKISVDYCKSYVNTDIKKYDYCVTHLSLYNNKGMHPPLQFLYLFKNLQYLYLRDNTQLYLIKDLQLQELDISGNCGVNYIPLNSPISRSLRILRITGNHYIKKIDHLYLTTLYCNRSQEHLITKYIPNIVIED